MIGTLTSSKMVPAYNLQHQKLPFFLLFLFRWEEGTKYLQTEHCNCANSTRNQLIKKTLSKYLQRARPKQTLVVLPVEPLRTNRPKLAGTAKTKSKHWKCACPNCSWVSVRIRVEWEKWVSTHPAKGPATNSRT